MSFYSKLLDRHKECLEQLNVLNDRIKQLPEGQLLCIRNGSYVKWLKSHGTTPVYIPKKERAFAEALALKKYFSLKSKELALEYQLLKPLLHYYDDLQFTSKSAALLDSSSCYHELLKTHFQTDSDKLQSFIQDDYQKSQNHPEHLIYKTFSGENVRSKSEVIIANTLYINKIPYRYECALQLDGILFYPDFTILHPITLKPFYWEHFGLMEQPSYQEKAFSKLKVYSCHSIIPSINLITTYETKDHPLDSEKIQQIINEYFR